VDPAPGGIPTFAYTREYPIPPTANARHRLPDETGAESQKPDGKTRHEIRGEDRHALHIVEQRSDPGICKIPDHRTVWEEKQQYEKAPTTMIPTVSHDAYEEDGSAFKL